MVNVIATGSTGNAVLYNNMILVDIGVPYSYIKPFEKDIQVVLLTHEHLDHININTLTKLVANRPMLRIACGSHMLGYVKEFKNVDVVEVGTLYNYGLFQIAPIKLYHDVINFGYRIFINDTKIIHATDTAHLEGISARNYDIYAIEHNYNEDTVFDEIDAKTDSGEFSYRKRAIECHLSEQQASEFIYKNSGLKSKTIRLHEHKIL